MPQATLRIRVDRLERRVDDLIALKDTVERMALQFSQFQDEMRVAIPALDATIRAGDEETRRVLWEGIRSGDEESRRFMRVLHEDLVDRIKTLREGGPLP